jgi:hypothetical protein
MEKGVTGRLALVVWSASVMVGLFFSANSHAEDTSFQKLDAEVEEVLNEVVSLGAEMAMLEESRELSPSNQLLVLVSVDPSRFFKLEAIQLKIDDRTVSYHQYSEADLNAMVQGGSHRLFWDDVPTGRHQLSVALFGRVPGDPDFQREATQMVSTGNGRRVVEMRVSSGRSQAFPEVDIQEWK